MKTRTTTGVLIPLLLLSAATGLFGSASPLAAQYVGNGSDESAAESAVRTVAPVMEAVRLTTAAPDIDGVLDDEAWRTAPVADGFVQFRPREGIRASQPTEARVLYGDDALYVAIRAYDAAPDSIVGQLTRRDESSYSDWLWVMIDSYLDRRTAFRFGVNPLGVKRDIYHFDDTGEDSGWNAVWDVATRIDAEGWTAEFRIPYSQLRFSGASVQHWGINFARDHARQNETSTWAPLSQEENAIVSRSGTLRGLENLRPPRRIEIQPYVLARTERAPGDPANPFHSSTDHSGAVGADIKYGITSNLTLDLTMNPDFGQVEADPGQVNLTAFETFLPERRPFFVEGSNIFRAGLGIGDGDGSNQSLFYSRRVGRPPQGRANPEGGYVDAPGQSRIIAAGKLSGKTADGWSIGLMNALTNEESARVHTGAGERLEVAVEPLASYSVARLQKDFREGRSAVGFIGTTTLRDGGTADALALHSSAYTGGVDFRHRFGEGGHYSFNGSILGSHVAGSEEALLRTQRSPVRYFQRPDADHVELDPTRTSLGGWTSTLELWKSGGGPWRFAVGNQIRSPGFEANDLGFMTEGDFISAFGYVGYAQSTPGRFRQWRINMNGWNSRTYGGEKVNHGGNVNGNVQFLNNWELWGGLNGNAGGLSTGLLRGGPAFIQEPNMNGWLGFGTDSRKDVHFNLNGSWNVRSESDSWSYHTSPNLRWRPSGRANLRVGPFISRNSNDRQWVTRIDTDDDAHFLFGRLDQTTFGLTARADYTFTPNLSLQVYAQPFMSSGEYTDFKQVADPRAAEYEDRFAPVAATRAGGAWSADLDGSGTPRSWNDPDFNVKQFRSNVVLRWEYRPGSTLFAVWAQTRDHFEADGGFHLG
ncbi:MAG: DUF5916 domain-containing protein, partial [Gemmatimonadota bacterium]